MRIPALLTALSLIASAACAAVPAGSDKDDKPVLGRIVVMETSKGKIEIGLYEKDAPITTKNFIGLVERKFYDGLTFHRYEPGFVVQGGDPKGNGSGGSDKTIKLEVSPKLKHDAAGVVAMARTSDPDSASSQFYFTLAAASHLDAGYRSYGRVSPGYAVFGRVTKGLDVVKSLRQGDVMKKVYLKPPAKPKERKTEPAKKK